MVDDLPTGREDDSDDDSHPSWPTRWSLEQHVRGASELNWNLCGLGMHHSALGMLACSGGMAQLGRLSLRHIGLTDGGMQTLCNKLVPGALSSYTLVV
eukprot:5027712-Prymnesium_polylepis.1